MAIVMDGHKCLGHLPPIGQGHQRSAASIIELSAMLSFYTRY
jgi:hypothetical protein